MSGRQLVYEDFADKIGKDFVVSEDGTARIPLSSRSRAGRSPRDGAPASGPRSHLYLLRQYACCRNASTVLEHEALGAVRSSGPHRQRRRRRDLPGGVELGAEAAAIASRRR